MVLKQANPPILIQIVILVQILTFLMIYLSLIRRLLLKESNQEKIVCSADILLISPPSLSLSLSPIPLAHNSS